MTDDERIRQYHERGTQPSDIADRMLMPLHEVHERMKALGLPFTVSTRGPKKSIWDMSEDDRRAAIISRAARGARKALSA